MFAPVRVDGLDDPGDLVEEGVGCVEACVGVAGPVLRRGVFTSVKDLNAKIRQFITGWNTRKHAFVWTKTADEILKKANRQPTSET